MSNVHDPKGPDDDLRLALMHSAADPEGRTWLVRQQALNAARSPELRARPEFAAFEKAVEDALLRVPPPPGWIAPVLKVIDVDPSGVFNETDYPGVKVTMVRSYTPRSAFDDTGDDE